LTLSPPPRLKLIPERLTLCRERNSGLMRCLRLTAVSLWEFPQASRD